MEGCWEGSTEGVGDWSPKRGNKETGGRGRKRGRIDRRPWERPWETEAREQVEGSRDADDERDSRMGTDRMGKTTYLKKWRPKRS